MSLHPLLLGVSSIVLMFVLATQLFGSALLGAFTSALFALTPVLWRQVQLAPESLSPLLFVLGWLLALSLYARSRQARWIVLAGALLGLGSYSSNAAAVMMPIYAALTVIVFWNTDAISARRSAVCVSAFLVAAAPLGLSWVRHPEVFRKLINTYKLYDADRFNVLQGVHDMVSWVGLTARTEVFYDYFNPAFLFLTNQVLLLPLIVLVPLGIVHILAEEADPLARISLAGFFVAPFAAALTAAPPIPGRMLFVTVFAPVLSTYGAKHLLVRLRRLELFSAATEQPPQGIQPRR